MKRRINIVLASAAAFAAAFAARAGEIGHFNGAVMNDAQIVEWSKRPGSFAVYLTTKRGSEPHRPEASNPQ